MRDIPAHHSHAATRIALELRAHGKSMVLTLGRESDTKREYGVFYPGYDFTANNKIASVATDLFDDR